VDPDEIFIPADLKRTYTLKETQDGFGTNLGKGLQAILEVKKLSRYQEIVPPCSRNPF